MTDPVIPPQDPVNPPAATVIPSTPDTTGAPDLTALQAKMNALQAQQNTVDEHVAQNPESEISKILATLHHEWDKLIALIKKI